MRKLSRRQFLANVAMAGGSLAVYNTSLALDLISSTEKLETLQLKPAQGTQTIAILGGGIAGLAVAHELGNAGYQVVILEASHRVGGRPMSATNPFKLADTSMFTISPAARTWFPGIP